MATTGSLKQGGAKRDEQTETKDLSALLAALQIPLERFCELLGLIYQGPLEAIPCGSAVAQLGVCLKANWGMLIMRPAGEDMTALIILDTGRGPELYESRYTQFPIFSLDPFVGLPPDQMVTIDEMIEPEKWLNGEFFKQYIEPQRVRYILGADIHGEGGTEFRLRFTRPPESADFSAADKAFAQVLIPHFKRAVNLHTRLGQMETEMKLYSSVMARMSVGTVILDGAGVVLRSNSIAQAILAEKDGIAINSNGMLYAEYRNEDRDLQRLVQQILEMPVGKPAIAEALSLTRPSGRAKLGLLIRPIPLIECSEGSNRPTVAVFIRDPECKSQPSFELVQQLFDFTPAEAKLALLLADGLTLDEAADELMVRKNTVRAHLRSIFSKTGVKRQITLVKLLLSSVASIS